MHHNLYVTILSDGRDRRVVNSHLRSTPLICFETTAASTTYPFFAFVPIFHLHGFLRGLWNTQILFFFLALDDQCKAKKKKDVLRWYAGHVGGEDQWEVSVHCRN
jgi:hypothetical protein